MTRSATTTAQAPTRSKRPAIRLVALVLTVVLLWAPVVGAKAFDEAAVKAVFLFRLALFVTWPQPLTPRAEDPFVIGILGADPFEGRLDTVVEGERIGSQAIVVRRYASVAEIESHPCQLLYLGDVATDEKTRTQDLAMRHKILTVSDTPRFAHSGGMMGIQTVARRIRITINLAATRQAGFSISAKLLKIAELISNEQP